MGETPDTTGEAQSGNFQDYAGMFGPTDPSSSGSGPEEEQPLGVHGQGESQNEVARRGLHRIEGVGHLGGDVLLDEAQFREFKESGLPYEIYSREGEMSWDAELIAGCVGESELSSGLEGALHAGVSSLSDALRQASARPDGPVKLGEVARAQRDLHFLLAATSVALGARSYQDGVEDRETAVWPADMHDLGTRDGVYRGREFIFHAVTDTFRDEGDYEGEDVIDEPYRYWGTLHITVDPSKRIEIAYVPERESAAAHHMSEAVVSRGERVVVHQRAELSLRIDLDSKAPHGIALDVGRGDFEGESMLREGDLLGKVMDSVRPDTSSHIYDGLTEDARDQFKPGAEHLITQLALEFQEHNSRFPDEELLDQIEGRMKTRQREGSTRFTELDDYLAQMYREAEQRRRAGDERVFERDVERYRQTHSYLEQEPPD